MNVAGGFRSSLFYILSFAVFLAAVPAFAGAAVSAKYLQPRGRHIVWIIEIPNPPPEAVIVTQKIPPGSEITGSSHSLSSYDKENGIAKWLLNSVPPGTLKMEIKISSPIRKKGEIHGDVLFKDDQADRTFSIFLKPRLKKKALEGC